MTLTPLQCIDLLKVDHPSSGADPFASRFFRSYRRFLERALAVRWLVVSVIVLLALAAPLVLDLALLLDLARRAELAGIQEWLSFYFKSPMTAPELYPEHDLFIQLTKLKNTMRWLMGEETITHLGHEYYD